MSTLMGFSGHAASAGRASAAARAARARRIGLSSIRFRLLSLEYGLALLHEGAAAFDVVLALEALEDKAAAELHVHVLCLQHLADAPLAGLDRERRARRYRVGVFPEEVVQ